MPERIRYEIDLSQPPDLDVPDCLTSRQVTPGDLHGLARLMLDAYIGTIDYEDETLDDAIDEVRGFLENEAAMLDNSFVVEDRGSIVSGILVSMVDDAPFIGYVMTDPAHKRQGLGRAVTSTALRRLAEDGHQKVVFYITEGNIASETLFRSLGAGSDPR